MFNSMLWIAGKKYHYKADAPYYTLFGSMCLALFTGHSLYVPLFSPDQPQ